MKIEDQGWNLSDSYRALPEKFYSKGRKARFPDPEMILWNEKLAVELGLNLSTEGKDRITAAEIFCGNRFPPESSPISQAYAGHQFGYFTMLGDGRAMILGEQNTPQGDRYDIQLKGSGKTSYSRGGDGKATLAPMLREYLISEALHALQIPTTRSLAVVLTGEDVYRSGYLPGAVLTRIASSHIRVGTFEFAALGETSDIQALADYTIRRHYPKILEATPQAGENVYSLFLEKVVERQARLIAQWQSVGFIHGVMNTDNMTISGESIDFGPCAFMDAYDPETVFSSIDKYGRYRYENQPKIGQWNLARLADSFISLLDENKEKAIAVATEKILAYETKFHKFWIDIMNRKLGLPMCEESEKLVRELLDLMHENRADHTNTFVRLTLETGNEDGRYLEGTAALFSDEKFIRWKSRWINLRDAQGKNSGAVYAAMRSANPFVIPRNFKVEEVLQAALNNDMAPFNELLSVLQQPYRYDMQFKNYQELAKYSTENYKTYCGT